MNYIFTSHAIQRMFEREIKESDVIAVINSGEIIQEYIGDKPFPSKLVLGFIKKRAIHVLFALNKSENQCIIITVYEPSPTIWRQDFKERG
ncbi:MAG: DUF4258 domain-containing protein [Calditrichaeota bacterium]|nr:MAG: DUF4258 domain-containing protein [Calditrichota bacterium]MBL1205047.1 DUF4258 domain-containing protein [Calditrichota bacterium]NOG44877.1 DUF4258 domain-containing protein [Calditrichota bacterium]